MREIQLTKGFTALVDDADYDWLSQWSWYSGVGGYAVRRMRNDATGKLGLLGMHTALMQPAGKLVTDHVNGDPMDNRRQNLRVVTQSENIRNACYECAELGRWVPMKRAAKLLGVKPDRMWLLAVYGGLPATCFVSRWLIWRESLNEFQRNYSQTQLLQMSEDCVILNSQICRGEIWRN